AAVSLRALRHLRARLTRGGRLLALQRVHELLQEERHSVLQLRFRRPRRRPGGDLLARARDDLVAVKGQELVEHVRLRERPSSASSQSTPRGIRRGRGARNSWPFPLALIFVTAARRGGRPLTFEN